MKSLIKGFAMMLVVVLILGVATASYAQDPVKKLGRGIVNVATGWIELPKNIYETSVEFNPFAGVTLGTAKGVGMTIVRTGAGLFDVVTFPFPIPEGYEPLLEPEFAFGE
ncbi:MAG: hypothetical protein AUJ75_04130 [Candidatus Omnitrophica bacterium CG1_02_49_10]|nr:MAG: hypothetical protein AUJ75_04130 [Candidatus Omnitrophica bacterium CG1_02_49_10]